MSVSGCMIGDQNSGAAAGCAVGDDHVIAGSAVVIGDSGCSSSVSIQRLEWKDCDTVGKIFGFVFGRAFNFVFIKGGRCLRHVAHMVYLDKVSEYFFRFMRTVYSTSTDIIAKIYTPTKKAIVHQKTSTFTNWTFDNVFSPLGRSLKQVARFFFKTLLYDSILHPMNEKIIKPLNKHLFSPCLDWTLVPFLDHIVCPILNACYDFIVGGISGSMENTQKEDK